MLAKKRTNVINRAICTAKKKEGTSGVITGNRCHFLDLNKDSKDKNRYKRVQEDAGILLQRRI